MPPQPEQILTAAQMREAEDLLIADGSSVDALMQIAGRGAADYVWRLAARHRVTVLCGPGNNGGDGYVIAEAIRERGGNVAVISAAEPKTDAARRARDLYRGDSLSPDTGRGGEVLVDCLFGSGLTRPLTDDHAALLSRLAESHRLIVAVDLPSGVQSDSGAVLNSRLPRYDLTIALGAWKFAHVLMPASAMMRALRLVDIGVEPVAQAALLGGKPQLFAPPPDAHKYRRGMVAVVGGAMPGAAALAAEAAARGGAGYVQLSGAAPVVASHAIVQRPQPDFARAAAILVGPGLGRDAQARSLLAAALGAEALVVCDADALFFLAETGRAKGTSFPAIITPHEGEFAHLFGGDPGSKVERTRAAANRAGSVIVHKGPDTVIAAPDGRTVIFPRATTWLSTAGTGDVFAGLCAARLAVAGDPFVAASEAAWLHGEAARLAGAAFVADELVAHIPTALASCL